MTTPPPIAETVTALARRYRLELDMGTIDLPEWTLVPGITEFTPATEPTHQEVTTYDEEGWGEHAVTKLDWTVELTLAHRAHPETGAFNAAQEALRKASRSFGAASYVHIRYFDRFGADDAYEGRALVTWEPDGGSPEDVDTISVTLTGSGMLAEIENPAGTGAGALASVTPLAKLTSAKGAVA
jgi:hypothetical protein